MQCIFATHGRARRALRTLSHVVLGLTLLIACSSEDAGAFERKSSIGEVSPCGCTDAPWVLPNLGASEEAAYYERCHVKKWQAAVQGWLDQALASRFEDFGTRDGNFNIEPDIAYGNGFGLPPRDLQDFTFPEFGKRLQPRWGVFSVNMPRSDITTIKNTPVDEVLSRDPRLKPFAPLFEYREGLRHLQSFESKVFHEAVALRRKYPKLPADHVTLRTCALYRAAEHYFESRAVKIKFVDYYSGDQDFGTPRALNGNGSAVIIDHYPDFSDGDGYDYRTLRHCPATHLYQAIIVAEAASGASAFRQALAVLSESSGIERDTWSPVWKYWSLLMEYMTLWNNETSCLLVHNFAPLMDVLVDSPELAATMLEKKSVDALCGVLDTL